MFSDGKEVTENGERQESEETEESRHSERTGKTLTILCRRRGAIFEVIVAGAWILRSKGQKLKFLREKEETSRDRCMRHVEKGREGLSRFVF